ncbi:guanine nucleotide binding protein, alpha subunit [Suillus subalutaceus]|uniref:guanine nucleotide binding protein, alpha subunit n=1 Tax=Suillus subalutaceus TaxID=48586 RepID=UPI001B873181|nr:guanine nucleotide binding protein, alpha subunit [Suillus subalutaceus]KAG1843303.1 guanine nucleotide binding protein, alpha subunit [Suillus subalutaceus]
MAFSVVFHHDATDPLAVISAPPPDESSHERAAREEREAEAQRISNLIDDEIRAERAIRKKEEGIVKILLLGQSESGKSTTLKNFRMRFARDRWIEERASWRAVILLNLVRSANTILDALSQEMDDLDPDELDDAFRFDDYYRQYKVRLSPLQAVESNLKRLLGATEDIQLRKRNSPTTIAPCGSPEFFVRSRTWRNFIQTTRDTESPRHSCQQDLSTLLDSTDVIANGKDDIKALWRDSDIQAMLWRRKTRLEDSAGFFLDSIDRLSVRDYEPTDDDVLRARLRTLDIQEHDLIIFPLCSESIFLETDTPKWKIFDVGGSRTQRHAWLPYFDQVNAVIFLAPISCFDERLLEDPRVNRLEDSFILWKAICSSKLLSRTILILFLNKMDILEEKIRNGVTVKRYLPSYGDRPNETNDVVKYLRQKFKDTVRYCSPEPRVFHIYPTSVIDTDSMSVTLISVRDGILREYLKRADLF